MVFVSTWGTKAKDVERERFQQLCEFSRKKSDTASVPKARIYSAKIPKARAVGFSKMRHINIYRMHQEWESRVT